MVNPSTSVRSPLSPTRWPPEAFRWWWSFAFTGLLLLASTIPAVLFFALLMTAGAAHTSDLRSMTWPFVAMQLVSYAGWSLVLVTLLPVLAQRSLRDLGLRPPRGADIAYGLVGAAVMVLIVASAGALQSAVFHLKPDEVQVQLLRATRGPFIAAFVVFACVMAPFVEELTFRGFVFNALRRYLPTSAAIVLSAITFGAIHWQPGNLGALLPLTAGGVVLVLVYYRSGSLLASMITHAVFNLVTVVLVVGFHQV